MFTLILKGDNNETDEDVHHEECDDNDVDYVIDGHHLSVVMHWTFILRVGVDGNVEKSGQRREVFLNN